MTKVPAKIKGEKGRSTRDHAPRPRTERNTEGSEQHRESNPKQQHGQALSSTRRGRKAHYGNPLQGGQSTSPEELCPTLGYPATFTHA